MIKKIIITFMLFLIPIVAISDDRVILPNWSYGENVNSITKIPYMYAMVENNEHIGFAAFSVQTEQDTNDIITAVFLLPIRDPSARIFPIEPIIFLDGEICKEFFDGNLYYTKRGYGFSFPLKSEMTEKLKKSKTLVLKYMKYPIGENTVTFQIAGLTGIIKVAAKYQEEIRR